MSMQPYQAASKASLKNTEQIGQFIADAAMTGGKIALGGAIAGRIMPLLSSFVPQDLAIKGLYKVSPTLGKFINASQNQGTSEDEILNFIKEKIGMGESKKEQPKEQRSVIEQYSPELSQFIQGHIQQGRSPIEAGALAQLDPKFKSVIQKMTADHKTDFSSILQSVFGGGQTAQQPQPGQTSPLVPGQEQQMQQQQQGSGQQALMAILQKIQQKRGA